MKCFGAWLVIITGLLFFMYMWTFHAYVMLMIFAIIVVAAVGEAIIEWYTQWRRNR